ncbi:MAG: ABC-F family ATP-binding cassette domain-containing protein [Clostridiales bacterium]|nr:ABC-F family ATP-binding cassette domain-containing protein [Clostridiales bacterium]
MSQINVNNLTFGYEGSFENVFENVSFTIDTDWKIGFIGRNGKGKTTFLKLLLGEYEYGGSISSNAAFDYFPYGYDVNSDAAAVDMLDDWKADAEFWRVTAEIDKIGLEADILYRPFRTLSFGEKTKVMLAVLFAGENDFLLIDEPTNHLDGASRETVKEYLKSKKGFILVSHDADVLDAACDHMLVLNRSSVEVVSGNFSSWWENKEKADENARRLNEKHAKEIGRLKSSIDRSSRWAEKNENTKIGYDPIKEHDRTKNARSYIGAKTKKMQARVKNYQGRMEKHIEEKEGLMNDVERVFDLKLTPLVHPRERLVNLRDFSCRYKDSEKYVIEGLTFELKQGERVFLNGRNGCGKSTLIKLITGEAAGVETEGVFEVAGNMKISYVSQDTTRLSGSLRDFAFEHSLDYTRLLAILNRMDFDKAMYDKDIADFSEGQKKKLLISASLMTPAHLYIWDEPLNYIDVFSRKQIEKLIDEFGPTMLVVEHDRTFREKTATRVLDM